MVTHEPGSDLRFYFVAGASVVLSNLNPNTQLRLLEPSDHSPEATVQGEQQRRRMTTSDRAKIVELYDQGMSTRDIAAELGRSKTGVLGVLKEAKLTMRPRGHQARVPAPPRERDGMGEDRS